MYTNTTANVSLKYLWAPCLDISDMQVLILLFCVVLKLAVKGKGNVVLPNTTLNYTRHVSHDRNTYVE